MSVRRERGWNSFNGRIVRRGEFADQRLLEKIVDSKAYFVARFCDDQISSSCGLLFNSNCGNFRPKICSASELLRNFFVERFV
jgi:hypothetical protein